MGTICNFTKVYMGLNINFCIKKILIIHYRRNIPVNLVESAAQIWT